MTDEPRPCARCGHEASEHDPPPTDAPLAYGACGACDFCDEYVPPPARPLA